MSFQHAGAKIRTGYVCNSPFANECIDTCIGDLILLQGKQMPYSLSFSVALVK